MPRKDKYISRTIKATQVTMLCINPEECEPHNEVIEIPGIIADKVTALKTVRKMCETETNSVCAVVDLKVKAYKAKMKEIDFLENAIREEINPDEIADETETDESEE